MQIPSFFHVDFGHLVTWAIIAIAWLVNRGMDWSSLKNRTDWIEAWQQQHDEECKDREKTIKRLEQTCEKLAVIVELSEQRITRLESHQYRTH